MSKFICPEKLKNNVRFGKTTYFYHDNKWPYSDYLNRNNTNNFEDDLHSNFHEFLSKFSKIEPLSNFDILNWVEKLGIPNFKGVFMREEILSEKPSKFECFIYNIDSSKNEGTHWVSAYIKNNKCVYFDSYGFDPTEELLTYLKDIKVRYRNTSKVQQPYEVICGHLCLYVLLSLSKNRSFYKIERELNECKILCRNS